MATDLEPNIEQGEPVATRPSLKITGLHIRGLKSINKLDLPEDGLAWQGSMPDFVVVGGINGSGKTTLLELLAGIFDRRMYPPDGPLLDANAWVDFQFDLTNSPSTTVRYLIGDREFFQAHQPTDHWFGHEIERSDSGPTGTTVFKISGVGQYLFQLIHHDLLQPDGRVPGVVYIPSGDRNLKIPKTSYKAPGNLSDSISFYQSMRPATEWKDSPEALLYTARWADLNAKEEGRPEEANHFEAYQKAFDLFFEGRRHLKWVRGQLVVETRGGATHDLSGLSSGEKQVILFLGELLHRWRPGSLLLIDEPELHLHESFQTRLWQALVRWQSEQGGQVILATQSGHLFRLAKSAMKVVLNGQSR